MAIRTKVSADGLGDLLKNYSGLDVDERELARRMLRKANYLELSLLLANPEAQPGLRAARAEEEAARPPKHFWSDPTAIAILLLAFLAVAAIATVLLQG